MHRSNIPQRRWWVEREIVSENSATQLYTAAYRAYILYSNILQRRYHNGPSRTKGLLIAAMAKIIQHNGLWVVPSQTSAGKSS
jgi:hypothetical protein